MAPVLNLLHNAYTIGSPGLSAPQANLMGTVAFGVFDGGLPWGIIGIGAAIAAVVIVVDAILEARQFRFRIPVMAFAVGVYLPFELNVPIFFGGCVAWLVNRRLDKTNASAERRTEVERMGLLAAAGFITGEALMGIGLAVPVAALHSPNAIALFQDDKGNPAYQTFELPSVCFVGLALYLLYYLAFRKSAVPHKPTP
jgi:putative OPT family oligopeptide transporter